MLTTQMEVLMWDTADGEMGEKVAKEVAQGEVVDVCRRGPAKIHRRNDVFFDPILDAWILTYLKARKSNKDSSQMISALAGSRTAGKVPTQGGRTNARVKKPSRRLPLPSSRKTRSSKEKGSQRIRPPRPSVKKTRRAKSVSVPSPAHDEEPEPSTPAKE
jgi:hypothetical protein